MIYWDLKNSAKVKKSASLCLTKHHATKTYWGRGGIAPRILNLCVNWRWVVSFTPGRFTPGTSHVGGWVGARAGLYAEEKRKIPLIATAGNWTPVI